MKYENRVFEDKSCSNVDYMETIRGKCWALHDKGVSYQSMAEACGVCGSTVRNFANCLRDSMNKKNWAKFSEHIEELYSKVFG